MHLLDSKNMVSNSKIKITLHPSRANDSELEIEAARGENLRQVLLKNGLTPYQGGRKIFNCRGMGICGTCKILVLENQEWWEKRSCQIQCFHNLEIQLK